MITRRALGLLTALTLVLAACGGEDSVPPAPEGATFSVVLTETGDRSIELIKAVRAVTGLGLAQAKGLVDDAPSVVSAELPLEEAEEVMAQLEAAGAIVELRAP